MKVTFKLTNEQMNKVHSIIAVWDEKQEEFWDNPCYNKNQTFMVYDNNVLSYHGERKPLAMDGGLYALLVIAGYIPQSLDGDRKARCSQVMEAFDTADKDNWSLLKVVHYETSDSRLKWWETLSSYLFQKGTVEECLAVDGDYGKEYFQSATSRLKNLLAADQPLLQLVNAINRFGACDKKVTAAFNKEEIFLGKKISKMLLEASC